MNYIAELFNCNEDLFYTIYDYLRFNRSVCHDYKIDTTDDFNMEFSIGNFDEEGNRKKSFKEARVEYERRFKK